MDKTKVMGYISVHFQIFCPASTLSSIGGTSPQSSSDALDDIIGRDLIWTMNHNKTNLVMDQNYGPK